MTQYSFDYWRIELHLQKELSADVRVLEEVHGNSIIPAADISPLKGADGVVLEEPYIRVGLTTADCMPLVIFGQNRAVALHVSRKTLLYDLLDKVTTYIPAKAIHHVFVGPFICDKHLIFDYEGPEIAAFRKKFPHAVKDHTEVISLSLRKAVDIYLKKWGVGWRKITRDKRCTYETPELPSYRRSLHENTPFDPLDHTVTVVWKNYTISEKT